MNYFQHNNAENVLINFLKNVEFNMIENKPLVIIEKKK